MQKTALFSFPDVQVRKSFFAELGIYNNETFIQQVYYDFILGKANQSYEKENYQVRRAHS
jgi:hypothetical protein